MAQELPPNIGSHETKPTTTEEYTSVVSYLYEDPANLNQVAERAIATMSAIEELFIFRNDKDSGEKVLTGVVGESYFAFNSNYNPGSDPNYNPDFELLKSLKFIRSIYDRVGGLIELTDIKLSGSDTPLEEEDAIYDFEYIDGIEGDKVRIDISVPRDIGDAEQKEFITRTRRLVSAYKALKLIAEDSKVVDSEENCA
ncbi:MAG: hypothetical protein WDZ42_02695 [Candidatus Saccharimonadales bacterium]